MDFTYIVNKLKTEKDLTDEEFLILIESDGANEALFSAGDEIRRRNYSDEVYIRGLIEFTNYCKNDCYYCGIRKSNPNADRYRLTAEEILVVDDMKLACQMAAPLGVRVAYAGWSGMGVESLSAEMEKICDYSFGTTQEFEDFLFV